MIAFVSAEHSPVWRQHLVPARDARHQVLRCIHTQHQQVDTPTSVGMPVVCLWAYLWDFTNNAKFFCIVFARNCQLVEAASQSLHFADVGVAVAVAVVMLAMFMRNGGYGVGGVLCTCDARLQSEAVLALRFRAPTNVM